MTPAASETNHCPRCDRRLTQEEIEYPERDECGRVLCDECFCELFHFTCCYCREHGHEDDRHNFVVVFDPEVFDSPSRGPDYTAGIYRVTSRPYYGGPIVGDCYLRTHALERVADVPAGADPDGYACGHLCLDCQRRLIPARAPRGGPQLREDRP